MARYRFGDELSKGGFGVVCEVVCEDDGWTGVAKRLLDPANEDALARFRREVKLQAQVDHPNVLKVRVMSLEVDEPWFAMERAEATLRELLNRETDRAKLVNLFLQVAAGIEGAHDAGIIHRDIKPENVLIFPDLFGEPTAVVSDFGLGRHIDKTTLTLTSTNIPMGTFAYSAPEQLTDAHNVDGRADVYSLGKLLYEVLTGNLPFPAMEMSSVPPEFRWVVQRATENDVERRYPGVAELIREVRTVIDAREILEVPEKVLEQVFSFYDGNDVPKPTAAEKALRVLVENSNDYTLIVRALPKAPVALLRDMVSAQPDNFLEVLRAYDARVDEGVTFVYCDVVADFYAAVFSVTEDTRVRELILRRLMVLGPDNNRWHVGHVFGRLLSGLSDPGLLMMLRDELEANRREALWLSEYVSGVPQILQNAFRSPPEAGPEGY